MFCLSITVTYNSFDSAGKTRNQDKKSKIRQFLDSSSPGITFPDSWWLPEDPRNGPDSTLFCWLEGHIPHHCQKSLFYFGQIFTSGRFYLVLFDFLFLLQFFKRKHQPTFKLTNITLPTSTEKLSNNRTWVRKKIKQQTQKGFPVRHDVEHHKLKIQMWHLWNSEQILRVQYQLLL